MKNLEGEKWYTYHSLSMLYCELKVILSLICAMKSDLVQRILYFHKGVGCYAGIHLCGFSTGMSQ